MTGLHNKYGRAKDYFLLLLLTLIVYWPLSLNLLSLKNDALVQYLAYRYHLSEAIQNGYMPFWSPYLYTGFPIHADIQGMVWNPIVIGLSFISRYNMTVLQWEVLIYLYIAAVGMYRLTQHLGFLKSTSFCAAASFLCCGYITDSVSVIPWIPSAGFIPFVLLYFLQLLRQPRAAVAARLGISLSLMFLCGYPSFFIFLNYVLLLSLAGWLFFQWRQKQTMLLKQGLLYAGLSYLIFFLVCSPAIISFYEFLPYYSRGAGLSVERAATNPFVPFSLLSYVIASGASKAHFLPTDISMRNAYIGLFVFLFFISSLFHLDRFRKAVLAFTMVALLFSLGNYVPVQKLFYQLVPLMNTFRHPATMRAFTSIGMILLAAYALDNFLRTGKDRKMLAGAFITLVLILLGLIYIFVYGPDEDTGFVLSFNPATLKDYLYRLSFSKFTAFILMVQLLFIIAFISIVVRKVFAKKVFIALMLLNAVVFAWMALPFTVVSQHATATVNNYIRSFPDGYPLLPANAPVEAEVISDSIPISIHGYHNFYNKKITIQDHIITPTLNSNYETFLQDRGLRQSLKGYPYVYLADSAMQKASADIKLLELQPNRFLFAVNNAAPGKLVLFQQYNHNWKAVIGNQEMKIEKAHRAFMSVSLPAGNHRVEWHYHPGSVWSALILSLITLLAIAACFLLNMLRKKKRHA